MYKEDVIQIVDVYSRHYESNKQTAKIDPEAEAQNLSMLIKSLGRHDRKIAIVAQGDERRARAFHQAGYETHLMNGNRPTELSRFIRQMAAQIKQAPPKHVVLVGEDPQYVYFCDAVAPHTNLAVWANSATVPRELTDENYGFRPLEDLLPNLKIPRIDVRIDLENIFIGLCQRGWRPNLEELIEAIRLTLDDLGEIVMVTGYADFSELDRRHGSPNANWQRTFTLAGGESRYVVNKHGKNTADMKIADDIRTVVEHEPSASNIIDIIALATMDRDFRPIVDTAQRRGKKVVVLGLEGGLSRELEGAASEVRFLNKFLKLPQPGKQGMGKAEPPRREDAAFMMRIAAWMQSNRWRFVYRDRLEGEFGGQATETEILKKLIADGWLVPSSNSPVDAQGQARSLEPNQDHIAARAAYYLSRWIPARVDFCLNKRGMPHVDINYLASGMARDTTLVQMNVGQTRADAESWLYAAASAGLVVAQEQPHPQAPTKIITTWRLPEEEVTTSPTTEATEVMRDTSIPTSSYLRHLLTQKLNDSELTRLLFDHFRPVHREVEGAPKFARIQALLDYVERSGLHQKLMAAIREINSALSEESPTQPLAA